MCQNSTSFPPVCSHKSGFMKLAVHKQNADSDSLFHTSMNAQGNCLGTNCHACGHALKIQKQSDKCRTGTLACMLSTVFKQ